MVSTQLKNISPIGNLPQVGMNINNIWNHQPAWDRRTTVPSNWLYSLRFRKHQRYIFFFLGGGGEIPLLNHRTLGILPQLSLVNFIIWDPGVQMASHIGSLKAIIFYSLFKCEFACWGKSRRKQHVLGKQSIIWIYPPELLNVSCLNGLAVYMLFTESDKQIQTKC